MLGMSGILLWLPGSQPPESLILRPGNMIVESVWHDLGVKMPSKELRLSFEGCREVLQLPVT